MHQRYAGLAWLMIHSPCNIGIAITASAEEYKRKGRARVADRLAILVHVVRRNSGMPGLHSLMIQIVFAA